MYGKTLWYKFIREKRMTSPPTNHKLKENSQVNTGVFRDRVGWGEGEGQRDIGERGKSSLKNLKHITFRGRSENTVKRGFLILYTVAKWL